MEKTKKALNVRDGRTVRAIRRMASTKNAWKLVMTEDIFHKRL